MLFEGNMQIRYMYMYKYMHSFVLHIVMYMYVAFTSSIHVLFPYYALLKAEAVESSTRSMQVPQSLIPRPIQCYLLKSFLDYSDHGRAWCLGG
jgi:hypothetical protein